MEEKKMLCYLFNKYRIRPDIVFMINYMDAIMIRAYMKQLHDEFINNGIDFINHKYSVNLNDQEAVEIVSDLLPYLN